MRLTSTRLIAAAAALALTLTIAGCTGSPTPSSPAAPGTPDTLGYPMPDIGPSPAPDALGDEALEEARIANEDALWQAVAYSYPEAQRPDIAFAGYSTEDNFAQMVGACYEAAGLTPEYGLDQYGNIAGVSMSLTTETDALTSFSCQAAHPLRPPAPRNEAQLDWAYDYLTQFTIPCYAANGVDIAVVPTRDQFKATWSTQNWFINPTDIDLSSACPLPD